jgi:para-nitrobenzyl esterase
MTAGPAPEVTTPCGRVRGIWRDGSAAFLGIPAAEAPVGARRFAAPVPKAPWDGVLDATSHGATPQRQALSEVTLIPEPSVPGESTLNVDVFTPRPEPAGDGDGLPVLVWIHGGGFVAGSPASPWYDGASFNRDGVVTVTLSYRLGFDGFGWIHGAPHNRGLRDWLLALEWVRENIATFGGDPARVTVAGQSAGGAAVLTLLASPAAQHLFSAAWALSAPVPDITRARAISYARRLATACGVTPDRAGFAAVDEDTLLERQNTLAPVDANPPEASQRGTTDATAFGPDASAPDPLPPVRALVTDGLDLGPVVDGDLLPTGVLAALRAGVGADKPLVLGTTDDEFSLVLDGARNRLDAAPAHEVLLALGLSGPVLDAYVAAHPRYSTTDLAGRYVTDRVFRAPALDVLAARGDAPTWLYRVAWRSPVFGKAVHCVDVPFWFDRLDAAPDHVAALAGPHPPRALAAELHGDAARFVAGGDPGWARWSPSERLTRVYDEPSGVERDGYADVRPLAVAVPDADTDA